MVATLSDASEQLAFSRIHISRDALAQIVGSDLVLLSLATSEYFALNAVGSRAWKLAGEGKDCESIRDLLLKEYEVERASLTADLNKLFQQLIDSGLATTSLPK